jgi:hypothetical protein
MRAPKIARADYHMKARKRGRGRRGGQERSELITTLFLMFA